MTKMKRCPFCGYPHPDLYANYSSKTSVWFAYVECTVCGSRSNTYKLVTPTDKDGFEEAFVACDAALSLWNTRAEDKEE